MSCILSLSPPASARGFTHGYATCVPAGKRRHWACAKGTDGQQSLIILIFADNIAAGKGAGNLPVLPKKSPSSPKATVWPCRTACLALRNGPFGRAKRPVLQPSVRQRVATKASPVGQTAFLAMRNAPSQIRKQAALQLKTAGPWAQDGFCKEMSNHI